MSRKQPNCHSLSRLHLMLVFGPPSVASLILLDQRDLLLRSSFHVNASNWIVFYAGRIVSPEKYRR